MPQDLSGNTFEERMDSLYLQAEAADKSLGRFMRELNARFTGEIVGAEGDMATLLCSDGEHQVPLAAVSRARLVYEITVGKKRKR